MVSSQSLSYYLRELESVSPQDILEIQEPIDRDFVYMALVRELDKEEFPPVIRCRMRGYNIPVVGNIFASHRRIARLVGFEDESHLNEIWARLTRDLVKPVLVDDGPIHELVSAGGQPDAGVFPWMQYYPTDAGRYLTSSIIVVKDPDTGGHNLSIHRMQYRNGNRFGLFMHCQHLYKYYQQAERQGRPLPVAVVIGAHPAVLLAAATRAAEGVDEYDVAGAILNEPLRLVRGRTVDVEYPAEAEIVLEGYISTTEHEPEGPFGEFTGYSTSHSSNHVFFATAICARKNPLYAVLAPGPSKDHLYMGNVVRRAGVLERMRERIPQVRAIKYPTSGVSFHAYIQMAPCGPGMAKQAITLMMGLDPMLKLVVAVDEDIDIHRDEEIMWALATRCRMGLDMLMILNSSGSSLDPSSLNGTTDKVGIDATMSAEQQQRVIVLRSRPEDTEEACRLISRYR